MRIPAAPCPEPPPVRLPASALTRNGRLFGDTHDRSRLGSMARPGADSAGGMEDGAMTDIAKLLREAAEHTRSDDATRYGYELADRLDVAATELERDAEPFGHVFHDFDGNPYFVDPIDPEYGEGFDVYRRPPTERAVPIALDGDEKGGRDWTFYAGGWNACREAMLAAAPGAGGEV